MEGILAKDRSLYLHPILTHGLLASSCSWFLESVSSTRATSFMVYLSLPSLSGVYFIFFTSFLVTFLWMYSSIRTISDIFPQTWDASCPTGRSNTGNLLGILLSASIFFLRTSEGNNNIIIDIVDGPFLHGVYLFLQLKVGPQTVWPFADWARNRQGRYHDYIITGTVTLFGYETSSTLLVGSRPDCTAALGLVDEKDPSRTGGPNQQPISVGYFSVLSPQFPVSALRYCGSNSLT